MGGEKVSPLGTELAPSEVEGALGRDDGKSPHAIALVSTTPESALAVPDKKFDVSDPEPGAGLKRPPCAGIHDRAVDRRAVGRSQVLDLQNVRGDDQPRMAPRYRRMRQNRLALVDIAADDEAFLAFHQPVECQFEAEFATRQVGTVES